jgi:hypothetical protein
VWFGRLCENVESRGQQNDLEEELDTTNAVCALLRFSLRNTSHVAAQCSSSDTNELFRRMAFHPSGKFLAIPAGSSVKCVDPQTGTEMFAFRQARTDVCCCASS